MTLMVEFHTKSCRKVADRRAGSNPVDVHSDLGPSSSSLDRGLKKISGSGAILFRPTKS